MKTDIQILKIFYSSLGVPQKIEGTKELLVLQKTALLGQLIAPSLDYSYNWYKKGPYSPSLTEACFELQGYLDNSTQFCFNEIINKNLHILSEIIHKRDKNKTILIEWLEALACIAFLTKKTLKSEGEAIIILANHRPDLNNKLLLDAVSTLRTFNLSILT